MKKLFAYRSVEQIDNVIAQGSQHADKYLKALDDAFKKIIMFPVNVHVAIIRLRLIMTDKYLEGKAKTCEALLKEMAIERKKIAKEQMESLAMLKQMRTQYHY